ncbi:hypothetical protein LNQ03_03325 [Klebsiella pneumoniae subsp. pneumoniae]|nr:hypothetical protein [Klebsiella pneumoniae subsp. pneumoniae]
MPARPVIRPVEGNAFRIKQGAGYWLNLLVPMVDARRRAGRRGRRSSDPLSPSGPKWRWRRRGESGGAGEVVENYMAEANDEELYLLILGREPTRAGEPGRASRGGTALIG